MKEMQVNDEYVHHTMINQSMGIKICAPGLDQAAVGTELQVAGPGDDLEELKVSVCDEFDSILNSFEKQAEGVYVKASSLGSLEVVLCHLRHEKIPVFDVGIGEVFKKDVMKTIMKENKHPEYAVILCFDVKISNEAKELATTNGVQIFTADVSDHLIGKFRAFFPIFPVILEIDGNHVFAPRDPIVCLAKVVGGQIRVGTPICIPDKGNLDIGRVARVEKDRAPVQVARKGETVCVKIEQTTIHNHIAYGRHFDSTNYLCSMLTRSSIDALKEHFKDEMKKEDWKLVIDLKKVFGIGAPMPSPWS